MKAIQIFRTGGPDVLEVIDLAVPKPGPGEVLVRAHAIGVAYFDMLIRSGRYPWMPELPYVPGNEMSGHIADANGSSLTNGQAVYVANWDNDYKGGFYADYLVASATAVRPLAPAADMDRAAALSNYVVASCLLDHGARGIDKGTLVIHGAAGGVGLALTELGRLAGFKVIGIASSDEKCALLTGRGVQAVNSTKETLTDRVLELTGGRGADLICNHIAGNSFNSDLKMIAPFGLIVSYGALGGLPAQDLFRDMRANIDRSPAVRCFTMHSFDELPALRDRCTDEVLRLFAEGKIAPHLGPILPLAEAAKAHAMLEQRGVTGKILLKPAWA
jgi:NADPH2:quinone reductase